MDKSYLNKIIMLYAIVVYLYGFIEVLFLKTNIRYFLLIGGLLAIAVIAVFPITYITSRKSFNFKYFDSYNGYTISEEDFLKETGFVELREFNFDVKDDSFNVHIGKIKGEVWYYMDNYGKIWLSDIGKIE